MIDAMLLEQIVKGYTPAQMDAIIKGRCPHCLPRLVPYRILETKYMAAYGMDMNRVKCYDIANCEWEELIPNRRSDNGLEGFFES